MTVDQATLARRIDQAAGREPADLVIRGGRILNVTTGSLEPADLAICEDVIIGTHENYQSKREIDASGLILAPGFIDTHVHLESSLVTPDQFERAVLPRGTTTAVCDPHEIANVLGRVGIQYFLDAARTLCMTLRVNLSSCVPATRLETSGARLEAEDLLAFADDPAVVGLAEMMNFPGVLAKDPGVLAKLCAFSDGHIDGHAPLLRGRDLNGYLAAGIRTDHESTSAEEAAEKLTKGMHVLAREGSIAKDVRALALLLNERTWASFAFCTDDRNPVEIAEEGHIDHAIRTAIAAGAPAIPVYRAATLGAAIAFGLRDRGVLAAGRRADLVLLDDLERCSVRRVICGGRLVEAAMFEGRAIVPPVGRNSVKRRVVTADDLQVVADGPAATVIEAYGQSLLTGRLNLSLPYRDGCRHADPAQGVLKLAVLERHGKNGNIGRGFVKGFGPLRGALAASIGHDSHNLIVVGDDDADMAAAANRLIELQGGAAIVSGGAVRAELPLPIAGLMSDRPLDEVEQALKNLRNVSRQLGSTMAEPLLQLAFLPLPVIPHLKLTDLGLVDVDRFELIPG